jgi:Plasmid replication region DNA-binding N-term
MAKPSSVTQADVDAIAITFMAQGISPSVNLVQSELKRIKGASGGTAVVTRLLQAWKEAVASSLTPKVRPGVPEDMAKLSDQIVNLALDHANELFAQERQNVAEQTQLYKTECDAAVSKVQESLATANASIAKANSVIDSLNVENMGLLSKNQELQATSDHLVTKLDEVRRSLALEAQSNQALREQSIRETAAHEAALAKAISDSAEHISTVNIQHAQKLLEVHSGYTTQIAFLNEKHLASIANETSLRERDNKRLMHDIDALRVQLANANKKISSDADSYAAQTAVVKRALEQSNLENNVLVQRVAFLEGNIQAHQASTAQIQKTLDALIAAKSSSQEDDKTK